LLSAPELINQSPYEKGYFFVLEATNEEDFKSLLKDEDYKKIIEG
ncbi:MAG: glycine cleavage system protein H, partial [Elusimicrobia bacterium]|nr:glycine cleavage system protein H [Elusimicrobiota bacterium]